MDEDRSPKTPYLYLKHNGNVYYDIPVRVVSSCTMDIFNFPFDVQNCSLSFGSYLHTANDVRVSLGMTAEKTLQAAKALMKTKGEWELVNIEARGNFLNTIDFEYDEVVYQLIIRRRPKLYVINLIVPSAFLMMIDLFSFLLPAQNVDRASFKMTLILGYTVFLLIMNDLLPSSAETPLIRIYFSVCLALMVISLLETVIITYVLHHSAMKYRPVPRLVRVLVLEYLARLICYTRPPSQPETPSNNITTDPQEKMKNVEVSQASPELQQICRDLGMVRAHIDSLRLQQDLEEEWIHVGYVLDYLLFRVYLVLITLYALVITCMWCIWYNL
ncbi:UNVERIFIED_CONTAM: hypothetical protein FKN15_056318 [Acipenser sinensis]